MFHGTYPLVIDGKNRLSIPSEVREMRDPDKDGRGFYVLPGRRPGTLSLYPEAPFRRLRDAEPPSEDLSDDAYEWRQFEYGMCELVVPDGQGRVVISTYLLEFAGLAGETNREVVILGVRDHLDLMRKSDYEAIVKRKAPDYPQHRAKAQRELRSHPDAPAATGAAS